MNRRYCHTLRGFGHVFASLFLYCFLGTADRVLVFPGDDVNAVLSSARPGDTVVLADGLWNDTEIVFRAEGTAANPIVLQAQTPGDVVFSGVSRLSIGGRHLIVDGLVFRGGALSRGHVIAFRCNERESEDCLLRNTAIIDYNPDEIGTRYFWVSLYGRRNIVEDCWFSGQEHSGVTLVVWLSSNARNGVPADHIIRRNYFGNRPPGNGNGFETIRVGTSTHSMTDAKCVVEHNLFEGCDGEIEIISNKSCGNIYRGNTFRGCSGCLTLRHGNRCMVQENVFVGDGKKGSGGVRVIGEGHTISDNWFLGLQGRAGGIVSLRAGIPDSALHEYFQVRDCTISGNRFFNNRDHLFALDAGYGDRRGSTLLPEGVVIADNLLVAGENARALIAASQPPAGVHWRHNVAFGGDLGIEEPEGLEWQATDGAFQHPEPPAGLTRQEVGPDWMNGAVRGIDD